jgi:ATP-dependent DNA helicase RecQ
MKVLIVARTRRGGGACVGGITAEGTSVRLIAADALTHQRAGLEYQVGEVWEIEAGSPAEIIPPHVENIVVRSARRLRLSDKLEETIRRFMPPVAGGPAALFDGLTQATAAGSLYISRRSGLPARSTMFWTPDQPLERDCEGKRIRYRYPGGNGGKTLTFVGFQDPVPRLPAGTLVRVSLAHWWRPPDRPDEEFRCFVQLSGWIAGAGFEAQPSPPRTFHLPAPGVDGNRDEALDRRAMEVLKGTFGFQTFLPVQGGAVARLLRRQDALVVMPTGGGKSLCYQLPALLFEGLTVVVSPLVALMQDQVRQLRALAIPAERLNHTVPNHEYTAIMNRVRAGEVKILYLAPETLLRPEILLLMERSRLACLAIDEAHCISEWGHDFRPEYRQLQTARKRFPRAVCLALTATATPRVREDIRGLLEIPAGGVFVASFNRANLFLRVEPRKDRLTAILPFLERHRGESGIIYCGTRRQTDEIASALVAGGWPALPYHAGLDDETRRSNQERFVRDEAPLMVATIAFGMGINKPNIRFIVHAHLPGDLESYYQEVGRAGRDGRPAECLLLFNYGDAVLHRRFIDQGAEFQRPGRHARLTALLRFAEARACRRATLLAYFGENLSGACGRCDNCVPAGETGLPADVTAAARQFLSCVLRTGQSFGASHVISILRGSRAARVLVRRHDRLADYGAGKARTRDEWQDLARFLIRRGLIDQDPEFGGLRLTSRGRDVLDGKASVVMHANTPPAGE